MSAIIEHEMLGPTAQTLCTHCATPVPAGLVEADSETQFCCEGCRAVYQTITGCGLADYYRLRAMGDETAAPVATIGGSYASFDTDAFAALYVTNVGTNRQIELVLEGVTCGACIWLIEKLPEVLGGVVEARLNLRAASVRVTWDPNQITLSKIANLLSRFGYAPHPAKGVDKTMLVRKQERRMLIDIGLAFALMGNLMLISVALYAGWAGNMDDAMTRFFRWLSVMLGVTSLAVPGRCFFVNAYRSIVHRAANLDLPIAIALVAGGVGGILNVALDHAETYFDSLSMLVFLLLVGRYIQHRQQRRADAAVELLFSMMPSTVHVERDGAIVDLPGEALVVEDRVEVRSGELVPGDGVILRGESTIDQALLTGESEPVEVSAGSSVFGGSLNRGRTIFVQLSAVGKQTRVGKLMELVEQGLSEKPAAMRFADRIGRWFIPGVCIAAAITFLIWVPTSFTAAIDHSVAMLIVTCPCVLGLATPLTMSVALGQLARRKILVKSAAALEQLAQTGVMAFDKTGTLTEGSPSVVSYTGDTRYQPIIAAIESRIEHPIARAIRDAYLDPTFDPRDVSEVSEPSHGGVSATYRGERILVGSSAFLKKQGITFGNEVASVRTCVSVAADGKVVARIALEDRVRADAAAAVKSLTKMDWSVSMLSGDLEPVASRVGREFGITSDHVHGQTSPEEKLAWIRAQQAQGRAVVMIGDGVNDAASLAAADVGVGVRGGAEATLAAADVYIATPGVMPLVDLIRTARRTMQIVRRNFAITLFYNVVAGALAITGVMNPLIAAIIMPLSGLTTIGFATASARRKSGE
jgi:Cu2+-exporting ATPase